MLPTAADSSGELPRSFSPPPASRLSALTLETSAARLHWARPLRSDRLEASTRRLSRRPRVCALDVPTWPPFGWKRCTNATSAARSFGGSPACPDVDPWHRMPSTVERPSQCSTRTCGCSGTRGSSLPTTRSMTRGRLGVGPWRQVRPTRFRRLGGMPCSTSA